jgi:YesN/AraC family two-component response regulator
VLLVEDQSDIARFIASCLSDLCRIELAPNGRVGLEKALELVPDIIVSDVMMPEMDGLEMLQALKHDARTSHIPVVMLSARTEITDKIAGLTRGAQAYLGKPFYEDELRLTIQNLLHWRQLLASRYQTELEADLYPLQVEKEAQEQAMHLIDLNMEDRFVQQILTYIESRLSDTELSIEDISREFGMSYRQLHRKLQALTGISSNTLIRAVRLSHARRLLRDNPEMNITEIAYHTGFSSLAYFSRVFHKEFGMAPKDLRNN